MIRCLLSPSLQIQAEYEAIDWMCRRPLVISLILAICTLGYAEDNTQTVIDSTTFLTNVFTVGQSGSHNFCIITNGGVVESEGGIVGYGNNANANTLKIVSTGSWWRTEAGIYVGFQGSSNQLSISNGGAATNFNVLIGGTANSIGNGLIVSGDGSSLGLRGTIIVGERAGFNQATIRAGATVLSGNLLIGESVTSGYNSVFISDSNTSWRWRFNQSYDGTLNVGTYGSTNRLVLSNGAFLSSVLSTLGFESTSRGNSVEVSGSDSLWFVESLLHIGNHGSANTLTIFEKGRVNARAVQLGTGSGSANNECVVHGLGSRLELEDPWTGLRVGFAGSHNRLSVLNGGYLSSPAATLGLHGSSSNNLVIVQGSGSLWTNAGGLVIGNLGPKSAVIVTNSGKLFSGTTHLGFERTSHDNSVVIGGTNSVWLASGDVVVGNFGSRNSVDLRDGATFICPGLKIGGVSDYFGEIFVSTNNRVLVAGGSLLVTNATLTSTTEVGGGFIELDGGTLHLDRLVITNNDLAELRLKAGICSLGGALISNAPALQVGIYPQAATLNIGGTNFSFYSGLKVGAAGTLRGSARIVGSCTNVGKVETDHLTILGDYVSNSGAACSLAVPTQPGLPVLEATDEVVIDGTLELRLIAPTPHWSQDFTLIRGRARLGEFANAPAFARIPVLGGCGSFRIRYSDTEVHLFDYWCDADSDGVDDAWAVERFGHTPLTAADKSEDSDSDGVPDWTERLAGTNPQDQQSVFRVTDVNVLNNGVTLEFCGGSERFYRVFFSHNLGFWSEAMCGQFNIVAEDRIQWSAPSSCLTPGQSHYFRIEAQ